MYFTPAEAIYSVIKFKKKENDPYQTAMKFLNEYIDLKKIIRKLQDVDKLKKILFNDSQRFFFELIPKPNILDELKKWETKNYTQEEKSENFRALSANKNDLNDKILSSLSEEILTNLKMDSKIRKILILIIFI